MSIGRLAGGHALEDLELAGRESLDPLGELAVGPPLHPEPRQ